MEKQPNNTRLALHSGNQTNNEGFYKKRQRIQSGHHQRRKKNFFCGNSLEKSEHGRSENLSDFVGSCSLEDDAVFSHKRTKKASKAFKAAE
jgi:hypothetical protein